MHYIGIDIGTSSICGVAYDSENKSFESVTRNNAAYIESSFAWEKTQDPSIIMNIVVEIIQDFTARYDIKGIGVTGQMHGILYVDGRGDALSPLYTWQDGRGEQAFRDNVTYAQYLSEKTDYPLATGFGLVTHFYNQKHGIVPSGAVKICTVMDYATMKLSGSKSPLMDYTNGAALGFFDLKRLCFDTKAMENVGVDTSFLPELKPSGTPLGYYKGNIPVYSAIGDNQASFIGSVGDIPHSVHITIGTSSQISVYSDKYVSVPSLDTRPFPDGGYLLVGAALCGGQSLAVLKVFFETTLKFFGANTSELPDIYERMTATPFKNSDELPVVETLFNGTRSKPWRKGTISNISTTNFTPENLILGFLKGISSELYNFFRKIPPKIKKDKTVWVGSGNGIRKNPLLINILEKQFNCRMTFSRHVEEAALGACIFANKLLSIKD
jgi:sedoheptulokinase